MPEHVFDEVYENGVLKSRKQRTVSDAEIERRDARQDLRDQLAVLKEWAQDRKTAADLQAMNAAQRIERQAEIEQRVARLARLMRKLIWTAGEDDGS